MEFASTPALRTIGLDMKAVARKRGADLPQHPLLPQQVLAFTRHWLALGGKTPPLWSQFNMMDVGDIVPYLTMLRCNPDNSFTFTFMGSAVSAILGEDLSGCTVSAIDAVWGEIDWFRRCKPVADVADIQVLSGATNPPYTSPIDFIAADFPFMDDAGGAVSHIIGVTVARMN
jgi:hypothetical protein